MNHTLINASNIDLKPKITVLMNYIGTEMQASGYEATPGCFGEVITPHSCEE